MNEQQNLDKNAENELENLRYFCQTYLHPDWNSDYSNPHEAFIAFCKNESSEAAAKFNSEIESFLQNAGEIPDDLIKNLGGHYSPSDDNLSVSEWLSKACVAIRNAPDKTVYQFTAESINGEQISFERYKNKVLLIVNTASKCGLTPQYKGLQELYEKYKDDGFEILGFPCNQFAEQEPGSNKEIAESCTLNYGVTFQMFAKIKVNGDDALQLFKFLRHKLPGILGEQLKWNFTKFLIDKKGHPRKRFAPTTTPSKISGEIYKLLHEN